MPILVFYYCCNELPQMLWFKIIQLHCIIILRESNTGVTGIKWSHWQDYTSLWRLQKKPFSSLFSSRDSLHSLSHGHTHLEIWQGWIQSFLQHITLIYISSLALPLLKTLCKHWGHLSIILNNLPILGRVD